MFAKLASAYVRFRLSEADRLPDWHVVTSAATVAADLSSFSASSELLGFPLSAYCGARPVLAFRGAFDKRRHSPRYPIVLFSVLLKIAGMPRPMTAKVSVICDALTWHCFWGYRPGMLLRVTRSMYTPFGDGFIFVWVDVMKTRQGDRLLGKAVESFVTAACHPLLTAIYARSPSSGPMFDCSSAECLAMLHLWFDGDAPEGFVVAHNGIRNGTDIALRALSLPEDFIDAHGAWARRTIRTSSYYAGLSIALLMAATSLLPLVQIRPVKPGWYDPLFVPPHPNWSDVLPVPAAAVPSLGSPVPVSFNDVSDDDGDVGLRSLPAPPGLVIQRRFGNRRGARR
jgi:hypothetical protein